MTRQDAREEQNTLFPNNHWPDAPGPTLPEICLNVRASISGAADPWETSNLIDVANMLYRTILTWEKGQDDEIDACVKRMCEAAFKIANAEIARRAMEKMS